MRKDNFYMMYPPLEPVREERYVFKIWIEPGAKLAAFMEQIPEQHRAEAFINCDGYGDPGDNFWIEWTDLEPDDVFDTRVKYYEKELKRYEAWKKKNKKKIEAVEKKRANQELIDLKFAKKRYEDAISKAKKALRDVEKKLEEIPK